MIAKGDFRFSEVLVDDTLEDSFPASDPPSWTASVTRPAPAAVLPAASTSVQFARRSAQRRRSEGERQRREGKEREVERLIGYIVTFAVMAGMGVALPRWFEWRRVLIDRLLRERKGAAHV